MTNFWIAFAWSVAIVLGLFTVIALLTALTEAVESINADHAERRRDIARRQRRLDEYYRKQEK